MLIDSRTLSEGHDIIADICIIGAGAAGITLARELMGSGLSICLLEAGGQHLDESDQSLSNALNTGLPYDGLNVRGRAFGGTTHYWAGMCAPLAHEDFEQRSWLPQSGWPITREELLPFYRKAQVTCEVGYFEYDPENLSELAALSLLPLRPDRVETVIYQNSPPTRFGPRYVDELDQADDVEVYLHAVLTQIILDEAGDRVVELKVMSASENHHRVIADRFVMAMGGIENARHLLAHRDSIPQGLGNESGTLGLFLEHPHYLPSAYILLKGDQNLGFYRSHRQATQYDDGEGDKEAVVYGALSLPAKVREREEIVAHACTIVPVDLDEELLFTDAETTVALETIRPLLSREEGSITLCKLNLRAEQRVTEACRLTLNWEKLDRFGLPIVELNWQVSELDHHGYQRALALIGAELGAAGIGRLYTPVDAQRKYAPGTPSGGWHHMGTTRMSESVETGVVDSNCKVHNLDNLYIAGSSVFPTGGYVNPTLTIVALAHRLGEHLKEVRS